MTISFNCDDLKNYSGRDFHINGYSECMRCGEYDKRYTIFTKDGSDMTYSYDVHRRLLKYFEDAVIICGNCSIRFGFEPERRCFRTYRIMDEGFDVSDNQLARMCFPKPTPKAIELLQELGIYVKYL
jgi:hypothetical protein